MSLPPLPLTVDSIWSPFSIHVVLGRFLIIISCSHLSLILFFFFFAKVGGWRYLEYLTLKGRLVFCWHHGGGLRGKGSGVGWGLLRGLGDYIEGWGWVVMGGKTLDWSDSGKMRKSQRRGVGLPWWFGVGWRGYGILSWVDLVLGIRLGLGLRLRVGTGWCPGAWGSARWWNAA